MSATFTKFGNQIYVGEHLGSCSDSPSGNYSIGWYCTKSRGYMDDKNYVLMKAAAPVVWGEVTSRVYDGKVSDVGRFALQLIGKTNQSTVRFFEVNGQEFGSKQFRDGLLFFDLSADGQLFFWNSQDEMCCVDLSTMEERFHFKIEQRFDATGAKLDVDGVTVLLQHRGKGWFRFEQNGIFIDKEKWLLAFIQDCDGLTLFQVISELYTTQGVKSSEEVRTYAQWIEESLRRGITDSYQFKVASVYEFLAKVHAEAGDLNKAALAKEEAEQHLDGFTLVDRAISSVDEIGNPPNQELAQKIIHDLDRATRTPRLLEYPNYVGKLYRSKGEVLELLGENEGAIASYKKALEANPEAGCKKQLEKLTKAPVVLPEKAKPKPTEERIHLEKATMFHFRCPVCGATPKEIRLDEYLRFWRNDGMARLERLFAHLTSATRELKSSKANSTKRFHTAADTLIALLSQKLQDKVSVQTPLLADAAPKTMFSQTDCPVCEKPSGLRRKDNYFTIWPEASRVQSSNLFYEVGLVLMGLTASKPAWLGYETSAFCDAVRSQTFRAGEAIGMMSCPQCGRFTSCLYGGTRTDPEKGMCRWCLDTSGANEITITINCDDVVNQ